MTANQNETTTYVYLTDEKPLPITGVVLNVPLDKDGNVTAEGRKMIEDKINGKSK